LVETIGKEALYLFAAKKEECYQVACYGSKSLKIIDAAFVFNPIPAAPTQA
jgi:hypothetical protein